jgi:hypothetical protein
MIYTGKAAKVTKIDFKVDHKGTLCVSNYQSVNDQLVRALNNACEQLTELDNRYLDHQDQWVFNHSNQDQEFYALKGFRNCQTFLSANIIAQRSVFYGWKRYHKESDLVQKGTVGNAVSSRVGKLVGSHHIFG